MVPIWHLFWLAAIRVQVWCFVAAGTDWGICRNGRFLNGCFSAGVKAGQGQEFESGFEDRIVNCGSYGTGNDDF